MLRRIAAAGAVALAVPALATPADAAVRTGRTSEGVAVRLDGRTVTFRAPVTLRRAATLEVECGRDVRAARRTASARVRARPGRRLRVRLPRDVSAVAEFCAFVERGPAAGDDPVRGAAPLRPAPAPTPGAVVPGPGVRTGATTSADVVDGSPLAGEDGDATFLLRGTVLTVRLARPVERSSLISLACVQGERQAGFRTIAVPRGRRVLTADIAVPAGATPDVCLIEDDLLAGDLAVARLGP